MDFYGRLIRGQLRESDIAVYVQLSMRMHAASRFSVFLLRIVPGALISRRSISTIQDTLPDALLSTRASSRFGALL